MIDLPGFADPVLGAQSCFRAVLDAMARPGSIHGAGLPGPPPLAPATAAVLLTLIDADTTLTLPDWPDVRDWTGFHCGNRGETTAAHSRFIVATELPDLTTLDAGSDAGPEESATVILQVPGFGTGRPLRLSGPGLKQDAIVTVDGLSERFAAAWAANHALFPRGIDLILCAGSQLAAFPRSLRIEPA